MIRARFGVSEGCISPKLHTKLYNYNNIVVKIDC